MIVLTAITSEGDRTIALDPKNINFLNSTDRKAPETRLYPNFGDKLIVRESFDEILEAIKNDR